MAEFVWYDYVMTRGRKVRDANGVVIPDVTYCMVETGEVVRDRVEKHDGTDIWYTDRSWLPAPLTVETAQ